MALSLATSLLRNPSRRPDLPESENLRLFHVEHTICSHLNIGLKFPTSLQAYLNFKFFRGGGSFPRNFTSSQSEPPPRPSRTGKPPIVPRGTHNLFTFKHRLEVSHFSASLFNLQVFWGAAALSLATSLLRNPSRRPDLPESENLRLFHVEHTICSHLNIGLKFPTSLQAYLIFKFFWGRRLFSSQLHFSAVRATAPTFPNLKTFNCSTWNTQFVHI